MSVVRDWPLNQRIPSSKSPIAVSNKFVRSTLLQFTQPSKGVAGVVLRVHFLYE